MKVLVVGANGYIGRSVTRQLAGAGHEVTALVRRGTGPAGAGSTVVGDLSQPATLRVPVADMDAVVFLVPPSGNEAADSAVIDVLTAGLRRGAAFVYTSGVWVLGRLPADARPFDEAAPTNPISIVSYRPRLERKVLGLAAQGVRSIVIRPGIVHGHGGGIPSMMVEWARSAGTGRYLGEPATRWPMVFVDDLARLYLAALEGAAPGTLWHGVGEEAVSVVALAAVADLAAGGSGRAEPWPQADAVLALGEAFTEALALDQMVVADRTRTLLGWTPMGPRAVQCLAARGQTTMGAVHAPIVDAGDLPRRSGPPARAEGHNPHHHVTQLAPMPMQEALLARASALPGVQVEDSLISVPGALAFHLAEEIAHGPSEAFQRGREFAHLHPPKDGSLHMTLPPAIAAAVYERGWGEPHPISSTPMVYGPRDLEELEVVWALLVASYRYATGSTVRDSA